jgi:hypothetical protein
MSESDIRVFASFPHVASLMRATGQEELARESSIMTQDDPTDEISDIEDRIERLAEIAERCRKYILASKIAIGAGTALLLITILGLFGTGQTAALGSIALVLGGIVSLGSNISTLRQTDEAIGAAEARRAALIGTIDLRLVADAPLKLV